MNQSSGSVDFESLAVQGIDLCRAGYWNKGLKLLVAVAEAEDRAGHLPGRFYSYLGYGMAEFENKYREGLRLCKHSVEVEFYQPENYVNLARTYLLMDARRSAIDAIERGLKIDHQNADLLELRREVGNRLDPVLPFLSRSSPVNRLLGKARYALTRFGKDDDVLDD